MIDSLSFFVGLFAGLVLMYLINRLNTTNGTLKIDKSNPEKDLYRFEIDQIENVHKKKRITLKIDPNADLSQK